MQATQDFKLCIFCKCRVYFCILFCFFNYSKIYFTVLTLVKFRLTILNFKDDFQSVLRALESFFVCFCLFVCLLCVCLFFFCLKALENEDTLLGTHCCRHKCFPFACARNICCGHKNNVSDFVQKHFVFATNVSQFVHGNKTLSLCPERLRPQETS